MVYCCHTVLWMAAKHGLNSFSHLIPALVNQPGLAIPYILQSFPEKASRVLYVQNTPLLPISPEVHSPRCRISALRGIPRHGLWREQYMVIRHDVVCEIPESFPGSSGIAQFAKSSDNGLTWQQYTGVTPLGLGLLTIISAVNIPLIGQAGSVIYTSTDNGISWKPLSSIPGMLPNDELGPLATTFNGTIVTQSTSSLLGIKIRFKHLEKCGSGEDPGYLPRSSYTFDRCAWASDSRLGWGIKCGCEWSTSTRNSVRRAQFISSQGEKGGNLLSLLLV